MTRRELVIEAIRANPLAKNRQLAMYLVEQHPDKFLNVEKARGMIRYYKGQSGKVNQDRLTHREFLETPQLHNAKILLFDLETAPLQTYMWSKWQKGVNDDAIISDWFILTWSGKWLFEDKIISHRCTAEEAKEQNDKRIVQELWQAFDEADIIIAHNLKKFDEKKSNTRFLFYQLPPPSPYLTIDTLLHARKRFAITSNRLDYIAKWIGIEGKMETPKGLWWQAMKGDNDALEQMRLYCDQDVKVLEDVYLYLRPYIKPHPNLGLFIEEDRQCCPSCGHDELEMLNKDYVTFVNSYTAHRCKSCGSVSRARVTNTPIKSKRQLTTSIPK